EDDPLYSGIIDLENIENQKPCLFQKLSKLSEWKQLNEIGLTKQKMPFNQHNIKAWLDDNENEVERDGKQLVHDFKRIWNNSYYQERSSLINKSTFTHDILPSIINFISSGFFKRWDQAQSLSAKDRDARKFGDVIGYFTGSDKNLYELFFVEVSYGPFHQEPEDHIDDDRKKLRKLGKDSIDRTIKLLNREEIPVIL
ncbi:6808_t:CDS:1, partial [Gigaspora margarita]